LKAKNATSDGRAPRHEYSILSAPAICPIYKLHGMVPAHPLLIALSTNYEFGF
jgi:hypothetical protein